MSNRTNNPLRLWEELKRRKVTRIVPVNAAASFVILELFDIISEPLGLPDWTITFVLIMLVIWLIVTFILSWVYDITPEGIQKTKHVADTETNTKKPISVKWKISTFVSILIILFFVSTYLFRTFNYSSDITKLEKSIAVLPFQNWSHEDEFSHLGNALGNEINTQLSKIEEFDVLSYTTSSKFKGLETLSGTQIGKELGANFVIEGTVERQNEDVSIHVGVVQVTNGNQVWVDKFSGEWNNIYNIQDEIALKVAHKLKAVLSTQDLKKMGKRPTRNLEAYNLYLRGNDFRKLSYEERGWKLAINYFEKAINLDPDFALAHTMLARAHMQLYWFHIDHTEERLKMSKEAIDRALAIEPDLADAHVALGTYYYWGFLDYEKAVHHYERALQLKPSHSESLYLIACVNRRMGNWDEATKGFIEAFNNDPVSQRIAENAATTCTLVGEHTMALHFFDQAISLRPDFSRAYREKIDLFLKWEGNTDTARKILEEAFLVVNPTNDPFFAEMVVLIDIYDGNYQDAINFLNTTNFEAVQPQYYYYPKPLLYANIYDLSGKSDLAEHYYELSRLFLEAKIEEYPDDSRLYASLGISHAGLGNRNEAIKYARKAVELLPISKEAWRGTYRVQEMARTYVMVGEYDLALEQLEILLNHPGIISTKLLQLDPVWKPLQDHPGFIELINKYQAG